MDARPPGGAVAPWIVSAVVLGLCLLAGRAAAQSAPRAEARVSADTVRVGERFRVTLTVERAADATTQFPRPDADPAHFGALEVLGESTRGTRPGAEGRVVDSVSYEATTFALDQARLPALPVRVVQGGDTTAVTTSAREVPVASVVGADAEGLRTGDPLAVFPRSPWPWLLGGLVGAALVGGGAYWWWARRQPEAASERTSAHATPRDAAISRLRTLAASADLRDRAAVKAFYVELSDIVRTYLARALEIRAHERTTRDVVAVLQHRADLPAEAVEHVQAVLERADLVKFAGVRPAPDTSKETYRQTRQAIAALQEANDALPIDGVASANRPAG
ncbi:MAG: hypothetical protein R6T83_09990 [Salinibacter sp.]